MYPVRSDVNRTPNSPELPSPLSTVPGVVVEGQIVHGHVPGGFAVSNAHVKLVGIGFPAVSFKVGSFGPPFSVTV
jgi:hypothetical protein